MFNSFSLRVRRAFAACRRVRACGCFAWQAWGIAAAFARRWIEGWRFAWQAWGMVDDACVKRMADVHVAWQAWDSVGVWEDARQWIRVTVACGFAHFDVAERAFRVAGVGHRTF